MAHIHYLSGTRASTGTWKIVEMSNYLFASSWDLIDMSYIPIQTWPN